MEDWSENVDPDMLTRRVTLDQYFADLLGPRAKRSNKTDAWKSALGALAKPGDEWWEWIAGSEPLMQSGGLALVRDATIVWACLEWIS